jgi:hypothetical protein
MLSTPTLSLAHVQMRLNGLSLPPLEKGRVGVGIALHIVRPSSAARDPLLTSPFSGGGMRQSEREAL